MRFVLLGGAGSCDRQRVARQWLSNPDTVPGEWLDEQAARGFVEYYPHQDEVLPYIQESDVVVLPSYYREGSPNCLLEAMSCGKAIITTNSPGCRELVEEGVNGLLVKPRDVESLVQAFQYMLNHPAAVKEMGQASRQIVLECFSDGAAIEKNIELYERTGLFTPQ